MGRVKDYILRHSASRDLEFRAVDTRGSGGTMFSVLLTIWAMLQIGLLAFRGQLAVVHVNVGDRGSFIRKGTVILFCRLARIPVVLHLHAVQLMQAYDGARPIIRFLIRTPFRAATCCLVLGSVWKKWLADELRIDDKRVEVVYNGVEVSFGSNVRISDNSAIFRFLFLGNLLERKGLSDLLRALALLGENGPHWRATIAGGGDIELYRRKSSTLGLTSRIEFVGWVEQTEAHALLANCDALVLPSYDEGLPLVILEALGIGTPVVCTPVGAVREAIGSADAALFVTPGDVLGLSRALERILCEPELRSELSCRGRELYREQFTADAFMGRLLEVYREHCGVGYDWLGTTTVTCSTAPIGECGRRPR
jgi:glycosyltransferase involved in cell wall biosynthesis